MHNHTMSKNEFSFHNRRVPPVNPSLHIHVPKVVTEAGIKETILEQYDRFAQLKSSNQQLKHLSESQEKISQEITATVSTLQKSADPLVTKQLSEKLNHLTDMHHQMRDQYDHICRQELNVLAQKWPPIYEKIIHEGIDRETLENVLTAYENVQSGRMNSDQAVMSGMDYMTHKYHLPTDFFNRSAVGQFNKDLTKLT
jgi:hypothetical protein